MSTENPTPAEVALPRVAIGVDVGGTTIKAAGVELTSGEVVTPRLEERTPVGAQPEDVTQLIADMVTRLRTHCAEGTLAPTVGVAVPSVVRNGITLTANNISQAWLGFDAKSALETALISPVSLLNDADAAGIAEVELGTAQGREGVTLVLTLGTGIGSYLATPSGAIPNTEIGSLRFAGRDRGEWHAAPSVMSREAVSFDEWRERLADFVRYLETILWPDTIVFGGTISEVSDTFLPLAQVEATQCAARFTKDAGIVGAALSTRHAHVD